MLSEALSLLSCLLNVLAGGQREMTFSAASWELLTYGATPTARSRGARRVAFVDRINRKPGHCRAAWDAHLAFWRERLTRSA